MNLKHPLYVERSDWQILEERDATAAGGDTSLRRSYDYGNSIDEVLTMRREFMPNGTTHDAFWSGDGIRAISFVVSEVDRVEGHIRAYQRCQLGT